jgi:hypothetical protein
MSKNIKSLYFDIIKDDLTIIASNDCKQYEKKNKTHKNHKFCFIIPGRNSGIYLETLLQSIKNQNYTNYRIIYISDGSTLENDSNIIEQLSSEFKLDILLIYNFKRKGPAFSRFIGSQLLNDDEICVFLDADDSLYSNYILYLLNIVYNTYDIGCTFGGDNCLKFKLNKYKSTEFVNSRDKLQLYFPHLRTCKSIYLKYIDKNYLIDDNNEWFLFCSDVALFSCLVEICNYKFICILNKSINYNDANNASLNTGWKYQNENKKDPEINKIYNKRLHYHKLIRNKPIIEPLNNNNNNNSKIKYNQNDFNGDFNDNDNLKITDFEDNYEDNYENNYKDNYENKNDKLNIDELLILENKMIVDNNNNNNNSDYTIDDNYKINNDYININEYKINDDILLNFNLDTTNQSNTENPINNNNKTHSYTDDILDIINKYS